MNTTATASPQLLTLLQLEKELRHAESLAVLGYVVVNRSRVLVPSRQIVLLRLLPSGKWRVEAVSDVAVLERDAPYIQWLVRTVATLSAPNQPQSLTADNLPEGQRSGWTEFAASHARWQPLTHPDGTVLGALLLFRDGAFSEAENHLLERLADTSAHAWKALNPKGWHKKVSTRQRRVIVVAVAALSLLLLVLPLPQSALAPAQVVPRDPIVVAAPIDGVIDTFHVLPNAVVAAGDPLFTLDDTRLRNALAVAVEELAVAEAELRTTAQGAFRDAEGRSRLAVLQARVALAQAERDWAAEQLSRVITHAPRHGLAVFRDPNDWIGRPVKTGEKVLVLADPAQVELRLHLAVNDAISLETGAPVRLFLDVSPMSPVRATLHSASYEADLSAEQILGYRVIARLEDGQSIPRIGLQGTARIEGTRAPIAYHVFRRPFAELRQFLGI